MIEKNGEPYEIPNGPEDRTNFAVFDGNDPLAKIKEAEYLLGRVGLRILDFKQIVPKIT